MNSTCSRTPEEKTAFSQKFITIAIIVSSAYIACQMLSDIASLKIGLVLGYAVDMGTFIYPLTFSLRDVVHKTIGKKNTRILIISAAVINLIMALYLYACAKAPSDPSWGAGEAFNSILSPVWRIVFASIIAEVISELVDTEVYHYISNRIKNFQWLRVVISNLASAPIDNAIFAIIAFAGVLPANIVFQIFMFNLIVKAIIGIIGAPLIYLVPNSVEKYSINNFLSQSEQNSKEESNQ